MKKVKPETMLERLIATIDSNCYIEDTCEGMKELPETDFANIYLALDYETCHKLVKEWEEIQEVLNKCKKHHQ